MTEWNEPTIIIRAIDDNRRSISVRSKNENQNQTAGIDFECPAKIPIDTVVQHAKEKLTENIKKAEADRVKEEQVADLKALGKLNKRLQRCLTRFEYRSEKVYEYLQEIETLLDKAFEECPLPVYTLNVDNPQNNPETKKNNE